MMRKTTPHFLLLMSCAALAGACSETAVPSGEVESTEEIASLQFIDTVLTRDGGHSIQFDGRSAWAFGETPLATPAADGAIWRSSTLGLTTDVDASDGIGPFEETGDAKGVPGEFLPLTADELAFNQAAAADDCVVDCGSRYAIWPGPMVIDPESGEALVFYSKVEVQPGDWNWNVIGQSIATWASVDAKPVRPEVRPNTDEPTLLFQTHREDPPLNQGAVVFEEYLYVYACEVDWLNAPCRLARVPVGQALDRDAYRFFSNTSGWVQHVTFHTVMDGGTMMSVHRNDYLGKFIAVHNGIVSADVMYHTANRPEGPWTGASLLFEGIQTNVDDLWNHSGVAHPEFAQEDGKIEYVTYFRPGSKFDGELRLVKVTFE